MMMMMTIHDSLDTGNQEDVEDVVGDFLVHFNINADAINSANK